MFPLHQDTIVLLAVTAVGAGVALYVATQSKVRVQVFALLLLGLVWPWPVAAYLGLDGYAIEAAFSLGQWTAGAVAAGSLWGLVARYLQARLAAVVVAILPSLASGLYVLERQRVPDAPCSTQVVFGIGDLSLALPRDYGPQSRTATGAPAQAWEGSYSPWAGEKPNVRALCRATQDGRDALRVTHLWLSFSAFRKAHEADCSSGSAPEALQQYCAAIRRTKLTVVQFYARRDGLPVPSLGHFNETTVAEDLSAGKAEGYRCSTGTGSAGTRYCTIWQHLTRDVLVVSSATLGPASGGEDPVADAAVALAALTERLKAD